MNFNRVLAALLVAVLAFMPTIAFAHSVGFDNDFTATLHFAPDDKPVAGHESDIRFIDIREQTGKFRPELCDCRATIYQNGRVLQNLQLSAVGPDLAGRYTFQAAGAYEVKLIGAPRKGETFAAFKISYPLQIDRAVNADHPTTGDYWAVAALTILLAGTGLAIGLNRTKKTI